MSTFLYSSYRSDPTLQQCTPDCTLTANLRLEANFGLFCHLADCINHTYLLSRFASGGWRAIMSGLRPRSPDCISSSSPVFCFTTGFP